MKLVRIAVLFSVSLSMCFSMHGNAGAQAMPTASKGAEVQFFGGFLLGNPDYGPFGKLGATAGGDFTVFPRWRIAPSFDFRAAQLIAPEATEQTVLFGPRAQIDVRERLHPYLDVLYGAGNIHFHPASMYPGYTGDRTRILAYGGGINIDFARHIGVKFDVQEENWSFGLSDATPKGTFTLTPLVCTAGVVYTIPFRKRNRREDFR